MFSVLQDVNSRLCQAPGAGRYADWISGVNRDNHYLLSTYYIPDAVLFHVHHFSQSSNQSDEITIITVIPILQMRKLKTRKFH